MGSFILENEELKAVFSCAGAELKSVTDKKDGTEKMWQGDPAYWGRTSPVLFPLVGQYRNGTSLFGGKAYRMGQHGFARDREFAVGKAEKEELWFVLPSDAATKEKYPFDFELRIGYRLAGREIEVMWEVENRDTGTIYFSIGAHPAFNCPTEGYHLRFDTDRPLTVGVLRNGLFTDEKKVLVPDENREIPITNDLFDDDALILENDQAHACAVTDTEGKPVVTVLFDAHLFGIWSPVGKNAPFVCIEPWYGRSDRCDFDQKLEEREWGNVLEKGGTFRAGYRMRF